ncbi:MAG: N-acetylmuramoyl-L-alanine amidase, partial [Lentisphaeria bacterium]|nr:N-acetylmuramoyl-L-alanine amidase [Lentisphaeria bacterium]
NVKRHKVRTVFIDPGHGGKDVGAEGRYYSEKKLTMRLAAKVRVLLKNAGFNVVMSRRSDAYLTLQQRASIANKNKADVFVSIHFNSAANKKVYGLETYCMTPVGASSSNASKIEWKSYNGNRHDKNNFALAYLMQRSMLRYSNALDRGVKHARFLVLREVEMPAVLVECGFLSNPESERIIGTEKYLNQIARGIAQSIISYKKVAENGGL